MTNAERTLIEFRNERKLAEILALKRGFTAEQARAGLNVPATTAPATRKITILSDDGRRRAIVTATDTDGVLVDYSKIVFDNAGRPNWRHLRTAEMHMPFHAALDAVHSIIHA